MKRPAPAAEINASRAAPPRSSPAARAPGVDMELLIGEIGSRGDGVALTSDGPIYAPYSLPGEAIRARVYGERADLSAIQTSSPDRVEAACKHFGRCGGCQLQHWAQEPYLAWKRDLVVRALERRNLHARVDPIAPAWGEGRRRAAFHANSAGRFGFMARGGTGLIPISDCPVLAPSLRTRLDAVRALALAFAPTRGDITIACLQTQTGLDVDIKGAGSPAHFTPDRLQDAARMAEEGDLARLSFNGQTVLARRTPTLVMGIADVVPPPGAFTQPTLEGERTLVALAIDALSGCARLVDLFAGIGTFALRFAQRADVHAVDGDHAMIAALKRAADASGGALRTVTVERRDLLRAPLAALELKRFDGLAFDPPRSGARGQAQQIAASKVEKVAAISCDPVAFARDAAILVDGGFRLERVTPIDQFRWSPHVEIVGAFAR